MLAQLETFLTESVGVSRADAQEFLSLGRTKRQQKGTYFIAENETPSKLAFVLEGLYRYVYLTPRGDEYTKSFMLEGSIISSYSAMRRQQPSAYFVEALEDSSILEIRYQDWQQLLERKPIWQKLLLSALEKGFIKKEARERAFLLDSAETRYETFLADYPDLEQRVSQRVVASYIGIQPESLSRIKKNRKA